MSFGNVPRDLCLTSLATLRSIASKSANGNFSADILLQYQRSPGVWVTAESQTVPSTQLGDLYTLPFVSESVSSSFNGSILAFGLNALAYGDSIVSIFTNTAGFYTETTIPLPPDAINIDFSFIVPIVSLNDAGDVLALGISADNSNIGAVWLYAFDGTNWNLQGSKITGVGQIGPGFFGRSVSLSGNYNLLAVGCPQDNGYLGAVYIFNLNNLSAPVFVQKLLGTVAGGLFGAILDLSADGSTLAVSFALSMQPILVYTNVMGTWTQQASLNYPLQLVCNSLSSDGNILVIYAATNAVIFYRTPGPSWSTGALLPLPYDLVGEPQGYDGSISHDGNTIFISNQFNDNSVGASWIFTQGPLGTWTQNGPGIVGTGGTPNVNQGLLGTLSGDGKVVALGNNAKELWVFV
jgi:hypothetical protein